MTYCIRPEKWNPVYIIDAEWEAPAGQWFIFKKEYLVLDNTFEMNKSTAADLVKRNILKRDKPPF